MLGRAKSLTQRANRLLTNRPPLTATGGLAAHIYSDLKDATESGALPYEPSRTRDAMTTRVKPAVVVAWARARGYPIPAAMEHLDAGSTAISTPKAEYSTPWLAILNAAIAEFFSPRRNPDAKKDEVVDWIKARARDAEIRYSKNIADAIFTVIKPPDHDPRQRRTR